MSVNYCKKIRCFGIREPCQKNKILNHNFKSFRIVIEIHRQLAVVLFFSSDIRFEIHNVKWIHVDVNYLLWIFDNFLPLFNIFPLSESQILNLKLIRVYQNPNQTCDDHKSQTVDSNHDL